MSDSLPADVDKQEAIPEGDRQGKEVAPGTDADGASDPTTICDPPDDLVALYDWPSIMATDPAALYDDGAAASGSEEAVVATGPDAGGGVRGPASSWSPRHEAHGDKAAAMLLPDQVRVRR